MPLGSTTKDQNYSPLEGEPPGKLSPFDSPLREGSCEKIEIKFDCGSPRPNGERGWGVRGIAVLSQRAFVFPHLERFFSLSWNSMRHASPPSPLAPLPRWGEGNRDRLIFSHLLTHYVSTAPCAP